MSAVKEITFKYLRSFKASRSVAVMSVISFIGIAIGVATLMVTFSVASGFGKAYREAILNFNAHVVLLSIDEIQDAGVVREHLKMFDATDQSKEEWEESRFVRSLLRPIQSLWVSLYRSYMTSQFKEDGWIKHVMMRGHPIFISEYLYSRELYPKSWVDAIVKIVRQSEIGIVAVNPFVYREGLLIHKGDIRGIAIKGVDLKHMSDFSGTTITMFDAVSSPEGEDPLPMIVLGEQLVSEISAEPGDSIRLMLPEHWKEGSRESFKEFRLGGSFESGMYDFDSQFVLLDIDDARSLFGLNDVASGFEIKLDDWEKAPIFAGRLEKEFPYPIYASHWQEMNQSLFEAVKLEKVMFAIIMGALVIVAAFNIIGTIMLKVLYKTSDIAIMRALGMEVDQVKRIYVYQGFIVGLLGTAAGLALAVFIIWTIQEYEWIRIPADIYLLKTLPVCISWLAGVMIAAFSLLVCWITSEAASKKVLDLSIVKGLHRP